MSIFNFAEDKSIGEVRGVDTSQIYIRVLSAERLTHAKVSRLVAIQGQDSNEWLIGIVNRVWRDPIDTTTIPEVAEIQSEQNAVQVTLVGTYRAKHGSIENYFTRAVLSLPDINRAVFPIEENALEKFMGIIGSTSGGSTTPLEIGTYTLDRKAKAFLDGDKLFQRHAALLGSTGSGKSWAVANILEKASALNAVSIILFDLHGEYVELPYARQLRVAGPGDLTNPKDNILFLPYWLLNFEEMQSLLVDNTEQSAPNQSMAVFEAIINSKRHFLESTGNKEVLESFTVNSPIPFSLEELISYLEAKNSEMQETGEVYKSGDDKGKPKLRQGPLHEKLTRMLIRLGNKIEDRRYGFLFKSPANWQDYECLHRLAHILMAYKGVDGYDKPGIKVIDFSEVPSDVLPVMVSLVARLVYQIQFWTDPGSQNDGRHPILLVCDEAHLYLPSLPDKANPLEKRALENFERIAKEGRKYGVGLFIISQRPSDVSSTILSQCNNIISLRLTNERDKSVVRSLLPDSLTGLLDVLPGLEIGEAVVVGDSTLLPTRIVLNKPEHKPRSATIEFWQRWQEEKNITDLVKAVENMRKQSRSEQTETKTLPVTRG